MIPLKVIENFGHLSICLDIAARKQQTHRWYFWVGIAREGFFWQQETGSAPRAFLCLRGAGAASVATGAGGTGVRGRRPGGWGLGIGGVQLLLGKAGEVTS